MSKKNPTTGTGVYYPACGEQRLFAYHGIAGWLDPKDRDPKLIYEPQELVATEEAFRHIWKQGAVYSNVARQQMGISDERSMFFGMDRAAGDDEYVFLNICRPHDAGKHGYHLVFDPYKLVEEGALIGLYDMQSLYMTIAENLGIEDRNDDTTWTPDELEAFRDDVEFAQDVWRLRSGEAFDWLEWIQGLRKKSPVNAAALRYVNRQLGARLENIIRWRVSSPEAAIDRAEILIPDELPLEWLVGVIFRKNWIEIDDFIEVYGPPGSEPPPALDFWGAFQVSEAPGYPARCPRCGDWFGLEPLEMSESMSWLSTWRDRMRVPGEEEILRVMVCRKCGAAFAKRGWSEEPFTDEEFVGEYGDLEYVYSR